MEVSTHQVNIESSSQLSTILGGTSFKVNSAHHQAVCLPGDGVLVVSKAPDGIIEAIELPQYNYCIGVQWHPEAMVKVSDTMMPLFKSFIQASRSKILIDL
jgi:putative glutamine amidotransferase